MSTHIDWPYPFSVVWFAERGQLLLSLKKPSDVFVTTTGNGSRIRCFRVLGGVIAPVTAGDTIQFEIDSQEFTLTLTPVFGKTGSAQIVVLSGKPEDTQLDVQTFEDEALDLAEVWRKLEETPGINNVCSVWQARVDPAQNKIALGPAQSIWPFGGRRVVKISKPAEFAPYSHRVPSYAIEFSTTDTTLKLDHLELPVSTAVLAMSWRSVVADNFSPLQTPLRSEFLALLQLTEDVDPRGTVEERVILPWPLFEEPGPEHENLPLIELRERFDEDLDIGDILVVCACSLPDWEMDIVGKDEVETFSAQKINISPYDVTNPCFRIVCWRVEPDRLAPQPWTEIDEGAVRELRKQIGALASRTVQLREQWKESVRKDLSAYRGNPADFEAVAASFAGPADPVRAENIFELGHTEVSDREAVDSWLERLPMAQLRKLVRMNGLPIDNIMQLLPVDLSGCALGGEKDWKDHDDEAGHLCAVLKELWERLGERDSYNELLARLGANLREFAKLPERIQKADKLLSDDDGARRKELTEVLEMLKSPSLRVDKIKIVHNVLKKFVTALDTTMNVASSVIERLSESLQDARDTTLTVTAFMAAPQATESELFEKLPATLSQGESLRSALTRITSSKSLSEEGRGRLRGVILLLGEQGRRVTAIARTFLDHLPAAQAEAYVRSVRFRPNRDEPGLDQHDEAKLAHMLEDFPSFARDEARFWAGRVIAIRKQLVQEERLQTVLDALPDDAPPNPAQPSGENTLKALNGLLMSSPADSSNVDELLKVLSKTA